MKVGLLENKDFLSGLMFIVIGAGAMFIGSDYPIGSALRMGPGYFPVALGGIIFVFGVYTLVQGLIKKEKLTGAWSVRALILLPVAFAVFGFLVDHGGFVPALVALLFISAAAGSEFNFKEVLIEIVVLTAVCVGLFIYALELPYPLFPWSR